MLSANIRKQGGAAIMTIPAEVLKAFNLDIGSKVTLDIAGTDLIIRPAHPEKKRYTLAELLNGVTAENMKDILTETEWAREGHPVGRELL